MNRSQYFEGESKIHDETWYNCNKPVQRTVFDITHGSIYNISCL